MPLKYPTNSPAPRPLSNQTPPSLARTGKAGLPPPYLPVMVSEG